MANPKHGKNVESSNKIKGYSPQHTINIFELIMIMLLIIDSQRHQTLSKQHKHMVVP